MPQPLTHLPALGAALGALLLGVAGVCALAGARMSLVACAPTSGTSLLLGAHVDATLLLSDCLGGFGAGPAGWSASPGLALLVLCPLVVGLALALASSAAGGSVLVRAVSGLRVFLSGLLSRVRTPTALPVERCGTSLVHPGCPRVVVRDAVLRPLVRRGPPLALAR